ncbi:pentapeptide repeat-containing protein [Dichotomicrobium thermohalophilum]|uniref:Pentapeptide repeat protein n=1 Tax=Dichotomicrobium thermohalophilum TaxID=933063 RepID=A0A397Q3Z4_9HYPH|nr:pentapeptide repeat-containing protein [Dichotomicrobium thermohalophilum]RIA55129.1 pentapeptide repeat protein [Dichotomicrobium thermohalophilum]
MSHVTAREAMSDNDARNAALLADVNAASGSARLGWVVFIALLAYFFVTLAGISHADLLLNNRVTLPILRVEIGLRGFFIFAPAILLLLHINLLLQHVSLSRKVREFHERVARQEGHAFIRTHRLRLQLHSYFYVQAIAGPSRSRLFSAFLHAMSAITLWLLPLALLIYFQIVFLPYHDLEVTTAQRAYILVDFLIFAIFWIFLHFPAARYINGLGQSIISYPLSFLAMIVIWVAAMFFSFAVATIPEEGVDRVMASIERFRTPVPYGASARDAQRFAFLPTAYLFEGAVNPVSGERQSWFSRNLVVSDTDLVGLADAPRTGVSLQLRGRDLRYATLDRSNLDRADLTGANLAGASLREAKLENARLVAVNLAGADLTQAQLQAANLNGADLRGATLRGANMRFTEGDYQR